MSPFLERAQAFLEQGVLSSADVHTVDLVAPRFGEHDVERMLGLAFAVRAPRTGHAGVDLGKVAQQLDDERLAGSRRPSDDDEDEPELVASLPWPDAATWQARTFESPLVGGPADRGRPFVRQELGDASLLLTRRMFHEQERVAASLRARARARVPAEAQLGDLDATLARLFPDEPDGESAHAVRLAASHRLAVVIGGPGTGKTFSITRLLAALQAERRGERPLVIALAAPTGKAAVRMREAIREATAADATPRLEVDDGVRAVLQTLDAMTLHRLVGVRPDGTTRHGPEHPIPADVIVVDEVSMVDLANMRRLVEAVPTEARLVLLGDRDQLASVEAGCVLADVVGDGSSGPLAANVQAFTRSRRFASAPDVALIAACLQSYATSMRDVPADAAARSPRAVDVFMNRAHAEAERFPGERVQWLGAPESGGYGSRPTEAQLDALARPYTHGFDALEGDGKRRLAGYAELLKEHQLPSGQYARTLHDPRVQRAVLDALDHHRVLAVHRRGPLGVSGLEKALAARVRAFLAGRGGAREGQRHWIGRPILITENAYDVKLMNGDVGVVLPTGDRLAAVFPDERPGEVRAVDLSRLPPHEGALAMTVHKSQGSQFDRVSLVLAGRVSPIQTRELVYTGVTRAKNQLAWLGTEAELRDALDRRVARASGLGALLREADVTGPSGRTPRAPE